MLKHHCSNLSFNLCVHDYIHLISLWLVFLSRGHKVNGWKSAIQTKQVMNQEKKKAEYHNVCFNGL